MRKKWISVFAATTVVAIGLTVPVFAQSEQTSVGVGSGKAPASGRRAMARRSGPRARPGRGNTQFRALRILRDPEVRQRLGLDGAQSQRLDEIFFGAAQQAVQLQADLKSLRLEMMRGLRDENPDRTLLEQKIEEIAAVRAKMARLRLDSFFEVRDLLTPEQRDLLRQSVREGRRQRRAPGSRGNQ